MQTASSWALRRTPTACFSGRTVTGWPQPGTVPVPLRRDVLVRGATDIEHHAWPRGPPPIGRTGPITADVVAAAEQVKDRPPAPAEESIDTNILDFCSIDSQGRRLMSPKTLGEKEQDYLDALRVCGHLLAHRTLPHASQLTQSQ